MTSARSPKTTRSGHLAVEACRDAPADSYVWDPGCPGLGLRVRARSRTWILRLRVKGRRKQFTLGHFPAMNPKDARDAAVIKTGDVLKRPVAAGELVKARTVGELLDHWLEHHRTRQKGRRPKDVPALVRHGKLIREAWGDAKCDEITDADALQFIREAAKGTYSQNRLKQTIRALWNIGRKWRFMSADTPNPGDPIALNKERRRTTRALRPEEIVALVRAAEKYPSPSSSMALVMLAVTGCRMSEILQLRRADVDAEEGTLMLRNRKDGEDLELAIGPGAMGVLQGFLSTHKSPWCFPSRVTGEPLKDIRKCWQWCRKTAKLPKGTRLHDLRAAVGTEIARTAGVVVASRVLGHKDIETTNRYMRPGEDEQRSGLVAWERTLVSAAPEPDPFLDRVRADAARGDKAALAYLAALERSPKKA